jgi:hypothetical protein
LDVVLEERNFSNIQNRARTTWCIGSGVYCYFEIRIRGLSLYFFEPYHDNKQ